MIKKVSWLFFLVMVMFSCLDEPDCFSLNNNIVGIAFKKLSDLKADTVFVEKVTADGTDSIFYGSSLRTGIDKLPLNYYQNETTFHFAGLGGTRNLTLTYSAKSQFVSADCGERFVLTGLKVGDHDFDSVRVVKSTPKRSDGTGTQIEIYRCPNTSAAKFRFRSAVSIESIGTDYEAAILFNSEPTTVINIPLNTGASSSTIEFKFTNGLVRTITVGYSITERRFFNACGLQPVVSALTITSSDFSDADVVRNTIQDPPQTNIEITF